MVCDICPVKLVADNWKGVIICLFIFAEKCSHAWPTPSPPEHAKAFSKLGILSFYSNNAAACHVLLMKSFFFKSFSCCLTSHFCCNTSSCTQFSLGKSLRSPPSQPARFAASAAPKSPAAPKPKQLAPTPVVPPRPKAKPAPAKAAPPPAKTENAWPLQQEEEAGELRDD